MLTTDPVNRLASCLNTKSPDLFHCTLNIASLTNPELNTQHYTKQMDAWVKELSTRVEDVEDTRQRVEHLNKYFFEDLGFKGNDSDYHNANNSLLHHVMDTRLGIPITLSILYITLGRHIKLPLEGVSFPGHFLVKVKLAEGIVMLDPYHSGQSLDEQALADLLLEHQKKSTPETLVKSLESASIEDVLLRVLRNLKIIYHDEAEHEHLLHVLNMMLHITPDLREERLERGLLLHEMECNHVALTDLRQYLTQTAIDVSDDVLKLVNRINTGSPPIH